MESHTISHTVTKVFLWLFDQIQERSAHKVEAFSREQWRLHNHAPTSLRVDRHISQHLPGTKNID